MRIYDISMAIEFNMPVYKGRDSKRPVTSVVSDFSQDSVYESKLEMNLHTGTHLDMPLHMIEGGKSLDSLVLERTLTKCKVIDLKKADGRITQEHLVDKNIKEGDFILLKTKNSYEDILEGEFVYLEKSGAKYLRDKKIIGVGIDALGIERSQPDHETHKLLMKADILILEGLRLKEIEEGEYYLAASPIKIKGVEASPVRALLIDLKA